MCYEYILFFNKALQFATLFHICLEDKSCSISQFITRVPSFSWSWRKACLSAYTCTRALYEKDEDTLLSLHAGQSPEFQTVRPFRIFVSRISLVWSATNVAGWIKKEKRHTNYVCREVQPSHPWVFAKLWTMVSLSFLEFSLSFSVAVQLCTGYSDLIYWLSYLVWRYRVVQLFLVM